MENRRFAIGRPNFHVKGDVLRQLFCTDSWPSEWLKTPPLTVITQRNFIPDFLQAKCDFRRKSAFLSPPLGGLGAKTYDDHLRLIGKRVMDLGLLLVLIELFSLGVTLRRYERISVQNQRFRSNGGRLAHNFRYKGSPAPISLLLRKLG